jgi:hypothetical protein
VLSWLAEVLIADAELSDCELVVDVLDPPEGVTEVEGDVGVGTVEPAGDLERVVGEPVGAELQAARETAMKAPSTTAAILDLDIRPPAGRGELRPLLGEHRIHKLWGHIN